MVCKGRNIVHVVVDGRRVPNAVGGCVLCNEIWRYFFNTIHIRFAILISDTIANAWNILTTTGCFLHHLCLFTGQCTHRGFVFLWIFKLNNKNKASKPFKEIKVYIVLSLYAFLLHFVYFCFLSHLLVHAFVIPCLVACILSDLVFLLNAGKMLKRFKNVNLLFNEIKNGNNFLMARNMTEWLDFQYCRRKVVLCEINYIFAIIYWSNHSGFSLSSKYFVYFM